MFGTRRIKTDKGRWIVGFSSAGGIELRVTWDLSGDYVTLTMDRERTTQLRDQLSALLAVSKTKAGEGG